MIEVGITSEDRQMTVETEKKRKYDFLATKLRLEHGCKTKINPYAMAWGGIVTNYMIFERHRPRRFGRGLHLKEHAQENAGKHLI